jgi:hypothetical protein
VWMAAFEARLIGAPFFEFQSWCAPSSASAINGEDLVNIRLEDVCVCRCAKRLEFCARDLLNRETILGKG